jgi:uncharacterized membrane protein YbhN (UPF0104 family)
VNAEIKLEEPAVEKVSKTGNLLKLALKIGVTVLCFWYISRKINFSETKEALFKADWTFVFLAVLSFMFSKFLASFRLNIYFKNIGIYLPQWRNIKLYWLGMFYNLFLPGSISGDAYKVILLTRTYSVPYKKTTAAVLLDRFSGVLALGLILSAYGVTVLNERIFDVILIAGSVMAVATLFLAVRFYFKDFLSGFWPTFFWGMAVQVFQVVCVYCILTGLHLPLLPEWIFIFLVASVVSIVPISLGGGLGTREFLFVTGADYFKLNAHVAVIISLLFYLSNVLSSIWGLYFVFHDPLKDERNLRPVPEGS